MKSAVNLTGRVDFPRENVAAQVTFDGGVQKMAVEWDLTTLNLPKDCEIKLDVWASGTYEMKRFFLGLLSSGKGKEEDIDVSEMRNSEHLKCRFVVTKVQSGLPMIVAQLDQISVSRLGDDDDLTSILKIVPDPDLTSVWDLRIVDGDPELRIKEKDGMSSYLKSEAPLFNPLVLPEALGKVFDWFIASDDEKNMDSFEEWKLVFRELGCDEEIITIAESDNSEIDTDLLVMERRKIQASFVSRHSFFDSIESQMENARSAE
jgi:hypothetical protein